MNARFAITTLAALALPALAHAQPFEISWSTVDGGGGTSTGGTFSVSGTIGQPDAGLPLLGGTFTVTGGFWVGDSTPACPADFNLDGSVDFFDYDDYLGAFEAGC